MKALVSPQGSLPVASLLCMSLLQSASAERRWFSPASAMGVITDYLISSPAEVPTLKGDHLLCLYVH